MLKDLFMRYLEVRGVSDSSVRHYINGLNTINTILKQNNFPVKDVYEARTVEDIESVNVFLMEYEPYLTKDRIGHKMYSTAFKHFYRFTCKDADFFADRIQDMDKPVPLPKAIDVTQTQWPRNQIIVDHAIEGAHFTCENNPRHNTFVTRATMRPYMEGHHLIPMRFQPKFNTGIDVYANVVCLCPICHRLMHFGTDKDRTFTAEKLFDVRASRLLKSGIDLSRREFIDLVI